MKYIIKVDVIETYLVEVDADDSSEAKEKAEGIAADGRKKNEWHSDSDMDSEVLDCV